MLLLVCHDGNGVKALKGILRFSLFLGRHARARLRCQGLGVGDSDIELAPRKGNRLVAFRLHNWRKRQVTYRLTCLLLYNAGRVKLLDPASLCGFAMSLIHLKRQASNLFR